VLLVLLRVSGKRTLSKMNAFDFVVTIALGSTLATVLLDAKITLASGATAFAVLIGLQFVVTWSSVRAAWVRRVVTGEPRMLLYQGQILPKQLRRARVTEDELGAGLRNAGLANFEDAEAVVLETDGAFSVIPRATDRRTSTLAGVRPSLKDDDC
jgi:uncharacterized membrane protein YcaP (DUF421 family)